MSDEAIQDFLKNNDIDNFFVTSAYSGENSDLPFTEMSQVVLRAIDKGLINPEEDQAYGVKLHPRKTSGLCPTIKTFADIRQK